MKDQHKIISFPEIPPVFAVDEGIGEKESSLSRNLRRFRRFGVRVLDFWRESGRWQVKVIR